MAFLHVLGTDGHLYTFGGDPAHVRQLHAHAMAVQGTSRLFQALTDQDWERDVFWLPGTDIDLAMIELDD